MQDKEFEPICKNTIEDWNRAFHTHLKFDYRKQDNIMWIVLFNGGDYIGTCISWYEMYHLIANVRAGMEIMLNHYSFKSAV